MAVDLSPWTVDAIIGDMVEQDRDWAAEDRPAAPTSPGTAVTMTESHGTWWPPDFGSLLERPE